MSNLVKDQNKLLAGHIQRAAGAWPVWIDQDADLFLVFQDYWRWKRDVESQYSISGFSVDGELVFKTQRLVIYEHNEISIAALLERHGILDMEGYVEIEITASDNIVFPFPAIMAYYTNRSRPYSCVHTAGRTVPLDEKVSEFCETNFFCSTDDEFSPFINIFLGQDGFIDNMLIEILDLSNNTKLAEYFPPPLTESYQSRTIYLSDHFDLTTLGSVAGIYTRFSGRCKGLFPRFICGNFEPGQKKHYVTHSFRNIATKDDVIEDYIPETPSVISLPCIPALRLEANIYPTCVPQLGSLTAKIKRLPLDCSFHEMSGTEETNSFNPSSNDGGCFTENVKPGTISIISIASTKSVPARIPVNLHYYCKGVKPAQRTDIALQFTTQTASKKFNYWGHFPSDADLRSVILLSTITSHTYAADPEDVIINLQCFDKLSKLYEDDLNLGHTAGTSIDITSLIDTNSISENGQKFYSWRIKVLSGALQDMYCVSYNAENGTIFGDHSF